jgi:hypothetical protein
MTASDICSSYCRASSRAGPQQGRGGGRAGQLAGPAVINQLQNVTTTTTSEIEVTITSRAGPQAPPSKLTAIVRRQGNNAIVQSKQW